MKALRLVEQDAMTPSLSTRNPSRPLDHLDEERTERYRAEYVRRHLIGSDLITALVALV